MWPALIILRLRGRRVERLPTKDDLVKCVLHYQFPWKPRLGGNREIRLKVATQYCRSNRVVGCPMMEVNMYTTIVIGSWVLSPTKNNVFTGLKQGWNDSICWYMQPLSTVGHGQSFFIFRLLFHMSARQAQLSKGTKSVTVVAFFNPRSMKLPATFQPLFTSGEFSDVLWHTERGMSRIYLHSHPFQLGTLSFWGDFRWVWICGGIPGAQTLPYCIVCSSTGGVVKSKYQCQHSFHSRSLSVAFT